MHEPQKFDVNNNNNDNNNTAPYYIVRRRLSISTMCSMTGETGASQPLGVELDKGKKGAWSLPVARYGTAGRERTDFAGGGV